MPTYALLGATGSTGSAILRCLLAQPPRDLTLHIFVRSKSKLLEKFPELESTTAFIVEIIEGTPNDPSATQECLKDVDVVMACIGTNYSHPGISLIHDTATSILAALEHHQNTKGPSYIPPTVIQLRSASLNPALSATAPWLAHNMATFCFRYVYEDLDRACKLFSSAATKGLLHSAIVIDPPSIHDPDGTTPTGYRLLVDDDAKQEPALSYADLGAAFCEVAVRREEFAGKAVGVSATGHVNETWGNLFGYIVRGMKSRVWG